MALTPKAILLVGRALFRGWQGPLVVVLTVGCAVLLRTLPTLFSLPRMFTSADVVAPLASVAALSVALAGFSTAQEPADELLATAPLRSRITNPIRVLAVLTIGTLLLWSVASAELGATASSVAALAGEGLIVARLSDIAYAWTVPTLHLLAALTFGAAGRLDLASWAWILAQTPTFDDVTTSLVLFTAAFVMWGRR